MMTITENKQRRKIIVEYNNFKDKNCKNLFQQIDVCNVNMVNSEIIRTSRRLDINLSYLYVSS